MDVQLLFKQLGSIRAVARHTGHSRNTIRRMLRAKSPPAFKTPARGGGIDDFAEYVTRRRAEHGLSSVRLLAEIRAQGFAGSIHMVRRLVRKLEPLQRAAKIATVRFETAPGLQAQCDWAYCGRHRDLAGRVVSVYGFVMVLGFSRALFVRFTTSMALPTLLVCHRAAFEHFGGIPKQILYDNMKQVRLDDGTLNPQLLDFAAHHGFAARTCRIRRPRTKGKVERMVDYVKDNFLRGRSFSGLGDLNSQAVAWLDGIANVRIHATTGQRPADLLATELGHLTPLASVRPWTPVERHDRKVAAESMVCFGASRYSVPPKYVGRTVSIELLTEDRRVVIRSGGLIPSAALGTSIAEHAAAPKRGMCMTDKAHLEELWKLAAQRTPVPPPNWRMSFDHEVAVTPLEQYEKAVAS